MVAYKISPKVDYQTKTIKEMKKELQKIVDKNKVLWTDWELFGKGKMRRKPNKSAKWLFEQAILEAYKLGLDFCGKIINPPNKTDEKRDKRNNKGDIKRTMQER